MDLQTAKKISQTFNDYSAGMELGELGTIEGAMVDEAYSVCVMAARRESHKDYKNYSKLLNELVNEEVSYSKYFDFFGEEVRYPYMGV